MHARAAGDAFEVGGQIGTHARRDHQRCLALHSSRHFQGRSHLRVRQCDDGQIGPRQRQIGQRARGLDVHKADFAVEALCRQVGVQRLGLCERRCGIFLIACKNQNRLGREKWREVVLVHDGWWDGVLRYGGRCGLLCRPCVGGQSAPIRTLTWAATLRASGLMT